MARRAAPSCRRNSAEHGRPESRVGKHSIFRQCSRARCFIWGLPRGPWGDGEIAAVPRSPMKARCNLISSKGNIQVGRGSKTKRRSWRWHLPAVGPTPCESRSRAGRLDSCGLRPLGSRCLRTAFESRKIHLTEMVIRITSWLLLSKKGICHRKSKSFCRTGSPACSFCALRTPCLCH